jgi:hypothetical protein
VTLTPENRGTADISYLSFLQRHVTLFFFVARQQKATYMYLQCKRTYLKLKKQIYCSLKRCLLNNKQRDRREGDDGRREEKLPQYSIRRSSFPFELENTKALKPSLLYIEPSVSKQRMSGLSALCEPKADGVEPSQS